MLERRRFLIGMGSLLAAPAIVHAGNLMPIKPVSVMPDAAALQALLNARMNAAYACLVKNMAEILLSNEAYFKASHGEVFFIPALQIKTRGISDVPR